MGLDALGEYAKTSVTFTPLKSDVLLRLLICDLLGEELTRASIGTLHDDIADLRARLEDAERTAHLLPHREKYLPMISGFMRALLELHLELVDEVELQFAQAAP